MKLIINKIVAELLTLCLFFMLCGCTHRSAYSPQLSQIDSLLNQEDIDTSAVKVAFRQVSGFINKFDEAERMHYNLLKLYYMFKTFQQMKNDSVLREVLAYYGDKPTQEGVLANYIGTGMYYDRKEYNKAQDCALNFLRMTNKVTNFDKEMRAKCHLLLGDIYSFHTENRLSLEQFKNAKKYANKIDNAMLLAESYYGMAQAYRECGVKDSSLLSCDEAYKFFNKAGEHDRAVWIYLEYAQIYNKFHDYKKSDYYLRKLENSVAWISKAHIVEYGGNRESYYQAKGEMLENLMQVDSALVFFKREISSSDLDFQYWGSEAVYRIYCNAEDVDSMKKYKKIFDMYEEQYKSTHDGYALQRKQLEYERELLDNDETSIFDIIRWILIVVLSTPVLVLMVMFCYKKIKIIKQNRACIGNIETSSNHSYKDSDEKNIEACSELSFGGNPMETVKDTKADVNLKNTGMVCVSNDNTCKKEMQSNLFALEIDSVPVPKYHSCEVYLRLRKYVEQQKNVGLANELWSDLLDFIKREDASFYVFLEKLQNENTRISKKALHMCMLIRAGFLNTEIGILLATNDSGICNMRARLARKILENDKAVAKDLDKIINGQ